MMQSSDESRRSLWASPVFAIFVLLTCVTAGIIGLITFDIIDLGMTHVGERAHLVHDLAFGSLFTTAIAGILAQVRSPSRNVAGMTMALIPWGALLLAGMLAGDVQRVLLRNPSILVVPLVVTTALLHPTGRDFFGSFRLSRVSWRLLALVAMISVPLLSFAATNIRLQAIAADMHATMGHYGFMAAFAFTVIGVGLLASLRPDGWRLPAWVAGLLPALLGVISLASSVSSGLSLLRALGSIAWGAAFVATAELGLRAGRRSDPVHAAGP